MCDRGALERDRRRAEFVVVVRRGGKKPKDKKGWVCDKENWGGCPGGDQYYLPTTGATFLVGAVIKGKKCMGGWVV